MIESTLEVGPFTPQELEDLGEKLKSRGVAFEVLKDEETERSEMKNDYNNIANKLGWRTETYLGQVFYLRLAVVDFRRHALLFEELGIATQPQENPPELQADISQIHQESIEQEKLKRLSARAVTVLWVCLWFSLFLSIAVGFFNFEL